MIGESDKKVRKVVHTIDIEPLLKGHYERELLEKGYSEAYYTSFCTRNIIYQMSSIYAPIADRKYITKGGGKPRWPDGAAFAVCLTHDVDWVSRFSLEQNWRRLFKSVKYLKNTREAMAIKAIKSSLINCANSLTKFRHIDPIHRFERWLKMEEEVGAKSSFFFLPEQYSKPHYTDGSYRYSDTVRFDDQRYTVAEMMKEIDRRGWEIGLHASWNTYDSLNDMMLQKQEIEKVLEHSIESVRQHRLHFDIRMTPGIQHKAGFKYDSSLGFNDNIGFRFGTCYPWKLFDWSKRENLDLLEVPLLIQDVALLKRGKYMGLNKEIAFSYIKRIINEVEMVGGVFTLLWHPASIVNPDDVDLYKQILIYLKWKKAWFGTVKSIGDYWINNIQRKNCYIGK